MVFDIRIGCIFWNIYHDGARTTCRCYMEGLSNDRWYFFRTLDHKTMLNYGPGDTNHIRLLESICPYQIRWNLTRYNHHRSAVHVGCRNTGYCVCGSRSRGYKNDTCPTGRPSVSVCHMRGGLFMSNQNVLNFLLTKNCIVYMQSCAPWISKNIFHSLLLK